VGEIKELNLVVMSKTKREYNAFIELLKKHFYKVHVSTVRINDRPPFWNWYRVYISVGEEK